MMAIKIVDKGFTTFLLATIILVFAGLYNTGWDKDLLTIGATLISAILAILAVAYNVSNQNRLAEDSRERKLIAAKASLSVALSDIVSLCEAHIEYLANGSNGKLDVRYMSENTKESIQLVIEFAEKGDRNSLVFLLNSYQVLKARNIDSTNSKFDWSSDDTQILQKKNTAKKIIDWASYKALVNNQFDYARTSTKIPDSASVRPSFERDLDFVRRKEMWLLINDDVFKKAFNEAKENQESGFFDPKYSCE